MSVRESLARRPALWSAWRGERPHLNMIRWLTAFKAALSAVIAIGLAMSFGWDNPYWAGISVMVVTLPYVGASLEKGAMRLAGTVLSGVFLYLITGAFPQNQLGYGALLFLTLVLTAYMGAGKFYPYAFILCGLTLSILSADTFNNIDELWNTVFYRVSEICLGIAVALCVNTLIFPQNAGHILGQRIGDTLGDFARLLEHAVKEYTDSAPTLIKPELLEEKLSAQFPKLRELLPQAILDSGILSRHRYSLRAGMQFMERMFVSIVTTQRAAASHYPKAYQDNAREELRAYTDALLTDIRELAAAFSERKAPPESTLSAARQALEEKLELLRKQELPFKYPIEDSTQFLAFFANLSEVENTINLLRDVANNLLKPGRESGEFKARIKAQEKPLWHLDPSRLKHGIKVGIAVLAAFYAWQWWQYPGGLQSVVTVGIVMQLTTVASNNKSLLRLLGCLLGGVCGATFLLLVTPFASTYLEFAPFLLVCFFFFGFLYYGPQKYAYAGFQAMIAFLLMTSITNMQSVLLKPGIERLFGILFGVAICAVVLRLIWPVIPERELRKTLVGFFGDCRDYLKLYTPRHLAGESVIPAERSLEGQLIDLPGVCQSWVSQIGLRNDEEPQRVKYHELALGLQSLRFKLQAIEHAYQRKMAQPLIKRIAADILALNTALAETFGQFEQTLAKGEHPATYPDLDTSLRQLNRALFVMMRKEHASRPHTAEEVSVFLALVRRYRELTAETKTCCALLSELDLKVLQRSAFF